jgi:6-pyruvoyltetrahydropterin/6-carboxytetrahydropterin synthase
MMYLTFNAAFNAVHKLWNPRLDEVRNTELFAECANRHGHLYEVEVTVKANVTGRRPVVIDRADIRRIVDAVLAPKLQDGDMNTAFVQDHFMSTGENIVKEIWKLVQPELPRGVALAAVRLVSTPNNSFVYFGDGEAKACY